ncbi:MAG: hypothetical protein Q4G69_11065 [Planctomycetia bacterium]|nr:hypothetical protein [Planctomycetia bacterium]
MDEFLKRVFLFLLVFCVSLPVFSQDGIFDDEKADGPFKKSNIPGGQRSEFEDPTQKKLEVSKDTPTVDVHGDVHFQHPSTMDPEKMTEELFILSLTAAEKSLVSGLIDEKEKKIKKGISGPVLFEAGARIAQVGRPAFGRIFLERSLKAQGTPAEYAAMADRVGGEHLIFLVTNSAVGPIGDQALDKALAEAKKYWTDPVRLEESLQKYVKGKKSEKVDALIHFRKADEASIDFLMDKLEKVPDEDLLPIQELLGFLGPDTDQALFAALDSTKEKLVLRAISLLGKIPGAENRENLLVRYYTGGSAAPAQKDLLEKAITAHFGKIPPKEEVIDLIYERALSYYKRQEVPPQMIDGHCSLRIFDPESGNLVLKDFTEEEYFRKYAAIWSKRAWKLIEGPTEKSETEKDSLLDKRIRNLTLALAASAEDLLYQKGLDKPLDTTPYTAEFPKATSKDQERALDFALRMNRPKGGIMPVVLLGKSGEFEFCYSDQREMSPLIRAACSTDRRLRFAALSAVARLNPEKSYFGSSLILPALIQFTTSTGARKFVCAAPQFQDALKIGNIFTTLGYLPKPAISGGEILRTAQEDADIELVVALASVQKPDMMTTVQMLEKDYRTGDIPVLVGATSRVTVSEPDELDQKKWDGNRKQIPADSEFGMIVDSVHPGSPYLTREVWAIRLSEIESKRLEALPEDPDKLAFSDQVRKEFYAPILMVLNTELNMKRAMRQGGLEKNALAVALPYDKASLEWTMRQLQEKTGIEQVGAPLRKAQAKAAAGMIVRLLTAHPEIYMIEDIEILIRRLIERPDLIEEGLRIAALVPSAGIQNYLANQIADPRWSMQQRERFLQAFADHLDQHGSKLRGPDIKRLYDRYNASEKEPREVQNLFSNMLDAYEAVKK